MRLLLAGGGTGGHLFPAVALAEQLRIEIPESEVLFVGTENGLEYRMLPELGWNLETIEMSGFAGLGVKRRVLSLFKLTKGFMQSRKILEEFQPDVVVGVGGYASVPVLLAAKLLGVPYLIHEQNAWPGLANRLLGRWARRICLSFPDADRAFHCGATVVTGNPVRVGMEDCPEVSLTAPCLLIFGGSLGARTINQVMTSLLPQLDCMQNTLKIIHQTGEKDWPEVAEAYKKNGWENSVVVPFITEMRDAYAEASLVICRAGATTLAELAVCGRPSILIPYPHAAGAHQSANARAMEAKGGAMVFEERNLVPEHLGKVVKDLLSDRITLQAMAAAAKATARHGAAARLLEECRLVRAEKP